MREITTSWQRKGRQEGRLEGRQEGRQEGRLEGRQEGRREGMVTALKIMLATRFGPSSQAVEARLEQCQEIKLLERLAAAVTTGSSLQELEDLM